MTDSVLQGEGIYFTSGDTPPGFFTLVLLRAMPGHDAESVRDLLASLWVLYTELRAGAVRVREAGEITVPSGNLAVVLGFSRDAFELDGAFDPPAALSEFRFTAPTPDEAIAREGENRCGIRYAGEDDLVPSLSRAHFAVQFTAETPLAVERAVVETWKLLDGEGTNAAGRSMAALEIAGVFTGSKRDDGRSWIDFHDGLSNLSREEREEVIAIKENDAEPWTVQGTYLAFIRLRIHLDAWHTFDRAAQERLVGRDKRDGCPLSFENGEAIKRDGCDGTWIAPTGKTLRAEIRDAGASTERVSGKSHIHRARNQRDVETKLESSGRIYRQGYPYFEAHPQEPRFRVGLNFVSFQNTPARLILPLRTPSWFGDANFGGSDMSRGAGTNGYDPPATLLTAYAAGMFFVPPNAPGERYPGARVLGEPATVGNPDAVSYDPTVVGGGG